MRQNLAPLLLFVIIFSIIPISTIGSLASSSKPNYFNVTFVEQGLPSGTSWSVNFNGTVKNSTSNEITFSVQGPSYLHYSIPDVGKLIPTPSSGYVFVNSSTTVNVSFSPPFVKIVLGKPEAKLQSTGQVVSELQTGQTYEVGVEIQNQGNTNTLVTVNETIILNGRSVTSVTPLEGLAAGASTFLGFQWTPSQNGVYDFQVTVSATPNITESASSYLYVGQTPTTVTSYNVTFVEQGLPSGTSWSVNFNGTLKSSQSNQITFQAKNGTYNYEIGNVSYASRGILGYVPSLQAGKVTVNGSSVKVTVNFLSLIFNPTLTLSLVNSTKPTQIFGNTSYELSVNVTNLGNSSGHGYLLILAKQGNSTLINKAYNFSLGVKATKSFVLPLEVTSAQNVVITAYSYAQTPSGNVPINSTSITLTVLPKVTSVSTGTSSTTNTSTSPPTTHSNTTTTTTSPNTTTTTTPPTSNVTVTPSPKSSNFSVYLVLGIVVVIVVIALVVVLLRRK
ncbi:CARDB domain-containing protein [Metallosphaera tengchongensis]|nr:CARDB domain-containing protein [Metallosphaera tengchongensis]